MANYQNPTLSLAQTRLLRPWNTDWGYLRRFLFRFGIHYRCAPSASIALLQSEKLIEESPIKLGLPFPVPFFVARFTNKNVMKRILFVL